MTRYEAELRALRSLLQGQLEAEEALGLGKESYTRDQRRGYWRGLMSEARWRRPWRGDLLFRRLVERLDPPWEREGGVAPPPFLGPRRWLRGQRYAILEVQVAPERYEEIKGHVPPGLSLMSGFRVGDARSTRCTNSASDVVWVTEHRVWYEHGEEEGVVLREEVCASRYQSILWWDSKAHRMLPDSTFTAEEMALEMEIEALLKKGDT